MNSEINQNGRHFLRTYVILKNSEIESFEYIVLSFGRQFIVQDILMIYRWNYVLGGSEPSEKIGCIFKVVKLGIVIKLNNSLELLYHLPL